MLCAVYVQASNTRKCSSQSYRDSGTQQHRAKGLVTTVLRLRGGRCGPAACDKLLAVPKLGIGAEGSFSAAISASERFGSGGPAE